MPETPAPATVLTGSFTVVNLVDRSRTDYGYTVPACDSRDPDAPWGGTIVADMSNWSSSVQHTIPTPVHVWTHPADTVLGEIETINVLCAGLTLADTELVIFAYDPSDPAQADTARNLCHEPVGWTAAPVDELEEAIIVTVEKAANAVAHRITEPGYRK